MMSPDALERGRLLFAGPVSFMLSAADMAQLPPPDVPEVAFAGRSNVGKSSLVNAITGRKAIARASVTPGRTQMLNLFAVGDPPRLRLVDMPGYGFAKAPRDVVAQWQKLVMLYLRGRPNLKRLLLLIDARHGLKPNDLAIMTLLDEAAVSYQLILTKADKLKDGGRTVARLVADGARSHVAAHPEVLVSSSETGAGIADVRSAIADLSSP